jgi:hypothetical protein
MTATDVPASVERPFPIAATYRQLLQMGFDGPEAANLAALRFGVEITPQPWTVRELTHLLFLRQLRRAGRQKYDAKDRADGADGGPERESVNPVKSPAVVCRAPADPSGGGVTLLTLLRSIAGPNATLDLVRPSATPHPRLNPAGDADREGG